MRFVVLLFSLFESESWPRKTNQLGESSPNFIFAEVNLDPFFFFFLKKKWINGESWPNDFVGKVKRGEDLRWVGSRCPLTRAWKQRIRESLRHTFSYEFFTNIQKPKWVCLVFCSSKEQVSDWFWILMSSHVSISLHLSQKMRSTRVNFLLTRVYKQPDIKMQSALCRIFHDRWLEAYITEKEK